VHLVDLATGVCTPAHQDFAYSRSYFSAERLPDGRIVCVGGTTGFGANSLGEVNEPPELGAPDAVWTWRQLPAMNFGRNGCLGCVMSDGRFAVLGGLRTGVGFGYYTRSCQVLVTSDDDEHWDHLPPMHDARSRFACEAVAGCIIVAGGHDLKSADVYDEALSR
jgi:hypothetical protein